MVCQQTMQGVVGQADGHVYAEKRSVVSAAWLPRQRMRGQESKRVEHAQIKRPRTGENIRRSYVTMTGG